MKTFFATAILAMGLNAIKLQDSTKEGPDHHERPTCGREDYQCWKDWAKDNLPPLPCKIEDEACWVKFAKKKDINLPQCGDHDDECFIEWAEQALIPHLKAPKGDKKKGGAELAQEDECDSYEDDCLAQVESADDHGDGDCDSYEDDCYAQVESDDDHGDGDCDSYEDDCLAQQEGDGPAAGGKKPKGKKPKGKKPKADMTADEGDHKDIEGPKTHDGSKEQPAMPALPDCGDDAQCWIDWDKEHGEEAPCAVDDEQCWHENFDQVDEPCDQGDEKCWTKWAEDHGIPKPKCDKADDACLAAFAEEHILPHIHNKEPHTQPEDKAEMGPAHKDGDGSAKEVGDGSAAPAMLLAQEEMDEERFDEILRTIERHYTIQWRQDHKSLISEAEIEQWGKMVRKWGKMVSEAGGDEED